MKLTIYLFREEAESFADLLREDKEPSRVSLRQSLSVPCEAWTAQTEPRPPKWADVVDPLVDVSHLINSSGSLVLLFQVRNRFFAVSFGYANSLLRDELLEHSFGLKVSANATDPERVDELQARTVTENSRQLRSKTTKRSSVAEFDLEVEREWLRFLKGDIEAGAEIAGSLGGSQSLSINAKVDITQLPELLDWVLDQFESENYKDKYPYVDNFTPIPKAHPIVDTLDRRLDEAISSPADFNIGIGSPDDLLGADQAFFKVRGDGVRNRSDIDELSIDLILNIINTSPSDDALNKLKITPFDSSENPIRTARKLRDYLVFEIDEGGARYVLCLGQWFRINADYVTYINEQVHSIDDVTDELGLRSWPMDSGWEEGDYNEKLCEARDWVLFDKKNFYIGGPNQKVEICDALTASYEFICVKRMERSATLSHLFGQASVSADLYWNNAVGKSEAYADHVKRRYKEKWPTSDIPDVVPRMVLAIATERVGRLADTLYFFSKVNLVQCLSDIRKCGFTPVLAKIERPPTELP